MILVVAGDYRQFDHWCKYNEINPRSRTVKQVVKDTDFRGYGGAQTTLVFVGTWRTTAYSHNVTGEFLYYQVKQMRANGARIFVAEDADPLWH